MIYVVLGMHKSGTTLTSQILHNSGIDMGDFDESVSYDQGNKYERQTVLALNEDILYDGERPNSLYITIPDEMQISEAQRAKMQQIIQDNEAKYENWGFKDPRTSLLYPLWASELPKHKLIVIYRSPEEQWQRYRVQHFHNLYREPARAWHFLKAWCQSNAKILQTLKKTDQDYVILDYQRLMTTQTEFDRLQNFVDMELSDQRKPKLYRNRPKKESLILKTVGRLVYQQTGWHYKQIMKQLDKMREQAVADNK